MDNREPPPIIVLGAGVVGLTTALKIQSQGHSVVIIADSLPNDHKTIRYTSHWAGAHHVFSTDDENSEHHKLEAETFKVFWELSEPGSDAEQCFLRITQSEFFYNEVPATTPLRNMPDFKWIAEDALIPGAKSGVSFTTVTIDTPVYLSYLYKRFTSKGGKITRGSVMHINQVIEGGARTYDPEGGSLGLAGQPPAAIVVCTGMGARTLGGVEDKKVYPIRGQTVTLKAPWVKFGRTIHKDETGAITYIIPRRSNEVIIGGTRVANDWYPHARPPTTTELMHRGLELCPELVPPARRKEGKKPELQDILAQIVAEGAGLRPAREGGVRLETEWTEGVAGRGKVPVIHNYGHGGAGFQASWGSADVASRLLEEALAQI